MITITSDQHYLLLPYYLYIGTIGTNIIILYNYGYFYNYAVEILCCYDCSYYCYYYFFVNVITTNTVRSVNIETLTRYIICTHILFASNSNGVSLAREQRTALQMCYSRHTQTPREPHFSE